MKRRTDTLITPQALLDECIYQPMQWPWKTVRLERNSLNDYRQRSMSPQVSIAELYHENSKLFPQMLSELTASLARDDDVRQEFLRRRQATFAGEDAAIPGDGLQLRELLTALSRSNALELFYAIEVLVLENSGLICHEPLADAVRVVKHLSVTDLDRLWRALHLMDGEQEPVEQSSAIFIVGYFSRNEILFGVRGYRRTLLEAGRVAQEILEQAKRLGLELWPYYEFNDRIVDSLLGADGTEVSCILAFKRKGDLHVG